MSAGALSLPEFGLEGVDDVEDIPSVIIIIIFFSKILNDNDGFLLTESLENGGLRFSLYECRRVKEILRCHLSGSVISRILCGWGIMPSGTIDWMRWIYFLVV